MISTTPLPRSDLIALGWHVLGPAYCCFLRAAIARCDALRLPRLYCLAREGHLLLQVYEVLRGAHRGPPPEARYLHVSRQALAGPGELAARYLAQEGLGPGPAALLDVGWSGTMQDCIAALLGHGTALHGLYLGLYAQGAGRAGKEGLLFDGAAGGLGAYAPRYCVALFEQPARGQEGTVLGYAEEGGRVVPRCKQAGADVDAERRSWPAVAAVQEGVLACARAWAADPPVLDAALRRRVQGRVRRLIFFPTPGERAALSCLWHTEGDGAARSLGDVDAGFYAAHWKPGWLAARTGAAAPLACALFYLYEGAKLRCLGIRPGQGT